MTCRIVQTQPPNNEGERIMFAFLKGLPADYTLYSELKLNIAFNQQVEGLRKKQPDFVVTGKEIGVVAFEVKDWNLDRNVYTWIDQYHVEKCDRRTGNVIANDIDNPGMQVEMYLHGLSNLIRHELPKPLAQEIWVSSFLAFPCLTRSGFLNSVQHHELLTNPQAKFYVDLDRILFKDDLDRHIDHPENLLKELVRRDSRFREASGKAIYKVNEKLIPPKCVIGGDGKLQEAREHLAVLSEKQARWAFSLNPLENYLLDVAGSGKTNALLSKAIHIVDTTTGALPHVLVTTYNRNLEKSLRRIFRDKVGDEASTTYRSIQVLSIPALLELVVQHGYGADALKEMRRSASDEEAYIRRLLDETKDILRDDPDRFRRFDHIFIDEIQDFSNAYLRVIKYFARGDSYFFVGDVGQKIYRRRYDLERLGLALHRKELDKSYRMYRTPRYIAELATSFVLGDRTMREEFASHGYTQPFSFQNILEHGAELLQTTAPERDVAVRIRELLSTLYPGGEHQILVVTSAGRLDACKSALEAEGVRCRIGEDEAGDAVTIVEFCDSKGLEREVVFILGVEDLYHRGAPEAIFDNMEEQFEKAGLDRRKVYVALTRPTERLYLYYTDRSHPYVKELCELNERIDRRRAQG